MDSEKCSVRRRETGIDIAMTGLTEAEAHAILEKISEMRRARDGK
jgi:hypothetical protein